MSKENNKPKEQNNNYADTEVSDTLERVGEMVLAFAGAGYGIYGNYIGGLSGTEALVLITLSFAFYQGTSIFKYFLAYLKNK